MSKKRIAVVMELDWPVNRHYEVLAGIASKHAGVWVKEVKFRLRRL